jgi:hypothetical protein
MKYLRWIGFLSSLLCVGVLGGLLAPLPSEALNSVQPTLRIDNVDVALTRIPNVNNACPAPDTAYNSCWSIPNTIVHTPTTLSRQIGQWYVGNYSATNRARVLINDASAAGSRDSMKMTGITFTPVVTTGTKVTHAIITHIFNEGGGNISGDYQWALAQGGQFDPPTPENVVGNKLKLTGTGSGSGIANFALGVLDTGTFTTSTIPNVIGYVTKSKAASVVKPACNTGSGRCAPTIKYDYEITVVGNDQLQLSDSVFGSGGVCYKGLKLKLLKLIDHIFDRFDHLADAEHPMGCTKFAEALNEETQAAVAAIVAEGIASGGVAVDTCLGGCIVINKTMVREFPVIATFGFTGTGAGINNFDIITDELDSEQQLTGTGSVTFQSLATGEAGGSRTIEETSLASSLPHAPDLADEDDDWYWWTREVSCESTLSGNLGTSGPSYWVTTDGVRTDNGHTPLGQPQRSGKVVVSNLAAGDTLTCTFDNDIRRDEPWPDPDFES